MKALILTGSNEGEPHEQLMKAIEIIESCGHEILEKSSVYESEPWGFESENPFLNQALIVQTDSDPDKFMIQLLEMEREMGRMRHLTSGYADRAIDLDIQLIWGYTGVSTNLEVPHPRMHLRRFCLLPCTEIASEWIGVEGKSVAQLLEECPDESDVTKRG